VHKKRVVIAPRGMLKHSALKHRSIQKSFWLKIIKLLGLHRRVIFHATSSTEKHEISNIFGNESQIVTIPNVPRPPVTSVSSLNKSIGHLRLAFVGRWHPIKNLAFVLDILKHQTFDCEFDIIGPKEDASYSHICETSIAQLPSNIKVRVHGAVSSDDAVDIVSRSHAMILPTEGENFGHAIFEALGCGTPVIISDQTQWRNLSNQQAGWDLPLARRDLFVDAIQTVASMDKNQLAGYRQGAHRLATEFLAGHDFSKRYLELFFSPIPSH
jgi:glycosyltransferase involved in cell wall biosynthesis